VLFGTWDGVFTSCLINVFGVIVFLRSGWIVAQAGILNAVLIIFCTVVIALVSVLSAIGICERCRVESGGVYFLIAHTLGSRFGGALGLLYCFGQAVGCALNVMGFGESMAGLVGLVDNKWAIRGFATAAVLLLGSINVAGVKWVIKLQFILLMILLISALDFMVGSFTNEPSECCSFSWVLFYVNPFENHLYYFVPIRGTSKTEISDRCGKKRFQGPFRMILKPNQHALINLTSFSLCSWRLQGLGERQLCGEPVAEV